MILRELGQKLNDMYNNAPNGEKVAMIHLFGIKYADQIKKHNLSTKEIAKEADIKESYVAEISKGIKLAKYVKAK